MKKFLVLMSGIFGVIAVVLFFTSIETVEGLNVQVTNIRETVFCAACAVLCGVNVVGAIILNQLEIIESATSYRSRSTLADTPSSNSSASLANMKNYKMGASSAIKEEKIIEGWKCKNCGTINTKGTVCKKCFQHNSY